MTQCLGIFYWYSESISEKLFSKLSTKNLHENRFPGFHDLFLPIAIITLKTLVASTYAEIRIY